MTTDPNPNPNRRLDRDLQGRADNDVTRAFWGDSTGWASQPSDAADSAGFTPSRGGIGATVARWWSSAGRIDATRTHSRVTTHPSAIETDDEFTDDEFTDDDITSVDGHVDPDADWDAAWEMAPTEPPRSGVDPLLARLGGLAVILTLLVPVVMGFTSDDGEAVRTSSVTVDVTPPATAEQPVATPSAPVAETMLVPEATPRVADATVEVDPTTTVAEAPVAAPVVEALAACSVEYQVVVGDFWIRIADGSGAALADVLAVNDATVSTPLYPGRSICLPDGASVPPPPQVAVAPTSPVTASPRSTSPATASPVTASPRSTSSTGATASTAPPPPPATTAGPGEVEAVIRSVWPDELEERALEIARRESNYNPRAKNSCCYGVFQVYWSVHRSWLSGIGVTSADQLYDPATNARAALVLYERSGGWGPWGG
ncbi:MAG TPA: hypothetical protein VES40_14280 [Ilumatobacteraceae bacterium]|nr:hypothetical protein [Ilumatobacteraceae bacterium]